MNHAGGDKPATSRSLSSVLTSKVNAMPVAARLLLSMAMLVCVAMLDTVTGNEISFSIFYLLPVSFAGAFISRSAGFGLAVASALTWCYLEIAKGHDFSAAWIPYWNSVVRLGFFVLVNELIQHLRRANARERALAREDSVTGIANARVFEEHASRAIAVSRRSGRPFTVAYIDLDGFKQVNDNFGHSEGDRLLRTIATLIRVSARSTDVVARLGGDEFGILMPDSTVASARASLERIIGAIAEGVDDHWGVGATVGAMTFTEAPEDVNRAVHEADALMYRGKAEGRGRIVQGSWPTRVT